MKMKKNYWVVKRNSALARWDAEFPPSKMLDPWQQWAFLKGVLVAGEEEGVYRVVETREPNRFVAAPGWNYIQYHEQMLKEQEELLFFQQLRNASPYRTETGAELTPAHLCYYDSNGQLTEAEVDNLGELLEQLRPELEWDRDYMAPSNPISFYAQSAKQREDGYCWPLYLSISLYTDIWFPRVLGYLEEWESYENPKWYDNRELASCHTPRLNRFLTKVKALTLNLGGEWGLADKEQKEVEYRQYAEMLTDDGIILNV
jgi:hypothetical protein